MSPVEITLIALSLSLDVAVVSIGAGALNKLTIGRALLIAFIFGVFHTVMPLLGWVAGYWFRGYLVEYGNIIGFILILLVGLHMLKGALSSEDTETEKNILNTKILLVLAVATSIDALVIGISFNFLPIPVALAVITIGIITFLMSLAGTFIGKQTHHLVGMKVELLGALALIALAFKVLLF
jgi:putative Mn2+ efflux pump MntP